MSSIDKAVLFCYGLCLLQGEASTNVGVIMYVKKVCVDDACLKRHVDVLARVVLSLELTDTGLFWKKIRLWSVSTLEEAIAEFEKTGDTQKFQTQISRTSVPQGHWNDFANLERELRPIAQQLGHMPSIHWLWKNNETRLISPINKYGGPENVAKRLGVLYTQTDRGQYTQWENVEVKLREVIIQLGGKFPSAGDLKRLKLSSLTGAINIHHDGMIAVRKRMEIGGGKHEHGYWGDIKNVKQELKVLAKTLGHFPGHDELKELGHSSLSIAIGNHGGIAEIREQMGHGLGRGRRAWGHWKDWDRVEETLRPIIQELGRFPEREEFSERRLGGLHAALSEFHDGVPAVRERLGLDPVSVTKGHWEMWENVVVAVRQLETKLKRFPSYRDMQQNGRSGLVTAIQRHHGGMNGLRKRLSQELDIKPMGYWHLWENVERELTVVIERIGHFPRHEELNALKLSSLSNAIHRFGGMNGVKERTGYALITDRDIQQHADVFARYIIEQNIVNTEGFWYTVKKNWTRRDLETAFAPPS